MCWIEVDWGTLVLSSRQVITRDREGKQRPKFTSNPSGLRNQRNAYAFVTCPILATFRLQCRASRLQQHQLGCATTEENWASTGRLRNLLASEPRGQCKGRIGCNFVPLTTAIFSSYFVDFLSYRSVLNRAGVLDIAQCITRGALRTTPGF